MHNIYANLFEKKLLEPKQVLGPWIASTYQELLDRGWTEDDLIERGWTVPDEA